MCDAIEVRDNIDAVPPGVPPSASGARRSKTPPMAVQRDASHYFRNNTSVAHIFSHELCDKIGVNSRKGTHLEARHLAETLVMLGFIVTIHKDKKKWEILELIKGLANDNHKSTDCLLIAVLSHGNFESGIYACDQAYELDTLWNPFVADRCPGMAGKPKWFFIQQCPIALTADSSAPQDSFVDGKSMSYIIPTHADFLFCHTSQASSFMRFLCAELQRKDIAKYHILQLFTFVNGRFKQGYPENPAAACCVTTRLTRYLQLQQREGGLIQESESPVPVAKLENLYAMDWSDNKMHKVLAQYTDHRESKACKRTSCGEIVAHRRKSP